MYIHVMVLKSRVDLRRVGRGGHDHSLFFENYFASFLLTNKKYHYVAGKCTGYPFPNFLDPPLLMCAITCTGKSTMPLNSLATCVTRLREKLNKDNSNVGNWWRPPLPVFLYWKPFQRGLQANSLCEAFRRVEICIAADLRRNPHQTFRYSYLFQVP